MNATFAPSRTRVLVVPDANVLYSRVLRDYLLYAATQQLVSLRWSQQILDECTRHLVANIDSFDAAQATRLRDGMNRAFPHAMVRPDGRHRQLVSGIDLPDPDDRHVLATAVAARADVLCTANVKDFPAAAMRTAGIERVTPDDLLLRLALESPETMRRVHDLAVSEMRHATTESTLAALERAGAPRASAAMATILKGT